MLLYSPGSAVSTRLIWDTHVSIAAGADNDEIALHPKTRRTIIAELYAAETGSATTAEGDRFKVPDVLCPICKDEVYLIAKSSLRAAHFRHYDRSTCPTKARAGDPYLDLETQHLDLKAGERIKASFRQNWARNFKAIGEMVPYFSPEEFIMLIKLAGRYRIWARIGLREIYLPSLFVLLADFPPWTGTRRNGQYARKFWFRFWFDSNIRNVEDLWIEQRQRLILYRASFDPPSRPNGRPAYEDLKVQKQIPIVLDFLTAQEQPLPVKLKFAVRGWSVDASISLYITIWLGRHCSHRDAVGH
ncbi:hypothetical protein AB4Y85_04510 [Microvirga sp. 2YAF29]|uniref:hypothetical protein n=1 Tax=Microvirga sp. 2YAF29 TaxID=3233031 RepID=UPI003F94DE9C